MVVKPVCIIKRAEKNQWNETGWPGKKYIYIY